MKVTTREYVEAILFEMDRRYEERFHAQEEAIRVRLEAQAVLVRAESARQAMRVTIGVALAGVGLTLLAEYFRR